MSKQTIAEINAKIAELQKQADDLIKAEFNTALAEVKEKIATYNFTAKDLGIDASNSAQKGAQSKPRGSVAPKYQKAGNVWTGRGRQPKWVQDHIAAGGKLEDLLIK